MRVRDLKEKLNQFDEDDNVMVMGANNGEGEPSTYDVIGAENKSVMCNRVVSLQLKEW